MKRLNIRLIVMLLVGFFAAAVGIHLLHGYQVRRNVDRLLSRAEKAAAAGDQDEQLRLLQRYVQHRREDLDKMKLLLKTALDRQFTSETPNIHEFRRVYASLEQAIRENPDDVGLRRLGFEVNSTLQEWAAAIDHAKQLRQQLSASNEDLTSTELVTYAKCLWHDAKLDECQEILRDLLGYDRATGTFDSAKAKAPQELSAYSLLAEITMREKSTGGDLTAPRAIVDQMITANPSVAMGYLRRMEFLTRHFERNEVSEQINADAAKALELAPDDPIVVVAAALASMRNNELPKAEQLVKDAIAKKPNIPSYYITLADLYAAQDREEEGLAVIEEGLKVKELENNSQLILSRASLEIDTKKLDAARNDLNFLSRKLDNARMQILEARMMMAQNDTQTAANLLENLRINLSPESPFSKQVLRLLLECYRQLNMSDRVAEISASLGENAEAMIFQADSLANQGRYQDAMKLYRELLERYNKDLTGQGRQRVLHNIINLTIAEERAKPAGQQSWATVDKMVDSLIRGTQLTGPLKEQFLIDILIRKGQTTEALKRSEQALSQYPNYAVFYLLVNQLTPDPDQGERILDQLEAHGDSLELRVARASRIVQRGGPDAVERLRKLEDNIDRLSLQDRQSLLQTLAVQNERLKEYNRSIEIWKKLLADNPKNLTFHIRAFDMAILAKNQAEIDQQLATIKEIAGVSSAEFQMATARVQIDEAAGGTRPTEQLRATLQLLDQARAKRPNLAPIYELQSICYYMLKEYELALDNMTKARELAPQNADYIARHIDILRKMNRTAEADSLVALLPENERGALDMQSEIRTLFQQDPKVATKRAKELFDAHPDDVNLLGIYHEILTAQQDHESALEAAAKLTQRSPTVTRGWLLQVRSLAAMNRTEDAEKVIAQIATKMPASDATQLLIGQCYSTIKDFEKADVAYTEGLKLNPGNTLILRNQINVSILSNRNDAAVKLLDQLIATASPSPEETTANTEWARRVKASLLVKSGIYQQFQEAMKLLEQNTDERGQMKPDDLVLWLEYHASRPDRASRAKATERLIQIQNERPLIDAETAVLASVYYQDKRWSDAKRLMVDLVSKNPDNPTYVGTYLEWLIERNELDDAAVWLKKVNTESPSAIRYQAILLSKQNKDKEAAQGLLKAVTGKQIDIISALAIMEELGQTKANYYRLADQQWKKVLQQRPEQMPNYLEFLARYPKGEKVGEVLTMAEKEIRGATAKADAKVYRYYLGLGLRALRGHRKEIPTNSPHFATVQSWLALAPDFKVSADELVWSEIEFHDIRRDYAKLEDLYRELLKQPNLPELNKAVVRNNLAFVYAISNRGNEALATIGDAINQLGPRSDFLDTRGLAYLASGKFDLALEDLRNAVSGGDAATFFHLALAEHKSGHATEAAQALQQAKELGLNEYDLSPAEKKLYQQLLEAVGADSAAATTPANSVAAPQAQ